MFVPLTVRWYYPKESNTPEKEIVLDLLKVSQISKFVTDFDYGKGRPLFK
jgi:hypothetical protein